jgi:RimJ/RimL family protein N-acetyltransferase
METRTNALGQPIGFEVPGWRARQPPPKTAIEGRWCRLEPISPERHGTDLHAANGEDTDGRIWTYLGYGPFENEDDYLAWLRSSCLGDDPMFFAVIDKDDGRAGGVTSYLRIDVTLGVIEVGHINFAPRLQRTRAATEMIHLMGKRAFDELGYRRFEWKCDALNAPSRRAAERFGFTYEGIFRQAMVYKGRNRDSAWYAMTDRDWPAIDRAFESWLAPENFDDQGQQRESLSTLMAGRDTE